MVLRNARVSSRLTVSGGFERFALVFLGGAVVVALGVALFAAAPNSRLPSAVPLPGSAPEPGKPAQQNGAASRAQMDVAPAPGAGGLDLDAVAAGAPVPRDTVVEAPGPEREAGEGREWFVRQALPLVLLLNESILTERGRLWGVRQQLRAGEELTAEERLWLTVTAERYRTSEDDLGELARRLDAIPPSIVLAVVGGQRRWTISPAGGESAGGTSAHLAAAGGQGRGPDAVEEPLGEAIRRLMQAFNTTPQFGAFRQARERLRREGSALAGEVLVQVLPVGRSPVWPGSDSLRSVILSERLDRFDRARLEPAPGPV